MECRKAFVMETKTFVIEAKALGVMEDIKRL